MRIHPAGLTIAPPKMNARPRHARNVQSQGTCTYHRPPPSWIKSPQPTNSHNIFSSFHNRTSTQDLIHKICKYFSKFSKYIFQISKFPKYIFPKSQNIKSPQPTNSHNIFSSFHNRTSTQDLIHKFCKYCSKFSKYNFQISKIPKSTFNIIFTII